MVQKAFPTVALYPRTKSGSERENATRICSQMAVSYGLKKAKIFVPNPCFSAQYRNSNFRCSLSDQAFS